MDIVVVVQWLHVLLGILWFGNALVLDVIVIPAMSRLPIVSQREISSLIGSRATPIFRVVVPTIIGLGIVRGTLMGPLKTIDAIVGTAYGITWLVGLGLTVAVYAFGLRVLVPALERMDGAPLEPDGTASVALAAATDRVKRLVGVELIGFLGILTCMILMRFGL